MSEDSDVVEEDRACEDADDCDYANELYEVETLLVLCLLDKSFHFSFLPMFVLFWFGFEFVFVFV